MLDNQVFSGIAGVVLAAIFAVVAYFYKRRRHRRAASAELVRVDVKEAIPQRQRLWGATGGFDDDRGQFVHQELWLPAPAELKIVCYNLTGTPVVIDQIRLLNADSKQEVKCFDGDSRRMDGFGSVEIKLELPLDNDQPYEPPPQWRGAINITTVRDGSFDSKPFEWGKQ